MNIRLHIREALSDVTLKKVESDLDSYPVAKDKADKPSINEVTPPGFESVVKALKRKYKKQGLPNWKSAAYATAWKMKNKGYRPSD